MLNSSLGNFLKSRHLIPALFIPILTGLFFIHTFTKGLIPFPGDLLLAEYAPWRHESYAGYNPGSIPNKGQYFDVIRELYPWKTEVIRQVKDGNLPLWNPYNFAGHPLLANYQSQVFYPPAALYYVLPQHVAWTILVIGQYALGMWFMWLYLRRIGVSPTGSVLGAVLFNFSSFASVWSQFNTVWHTILWLPLLLYLIERTIKAPFHGHAWKILFVGALFSSMTAGHPQDFLNTFIFLILYGAFRFLHAGIRRYAREITMLVSLTVIAFLLAAPQLLATFGLFRSSARVPHDIDHILSTMLFQWWQLPMIIIQDYFGNPATKSYMLTDTYVGKAASLGAAGMMLALYGIAAAAAGWHKRFFVGAALMLLVLSVNSPLTHAFFSYPIPILSTGTPTRNLFLFIFSLSVIAGMGFDALRPVSRRWIRTFAVSVSSIYVMLIGFRFLIPAIAPPLLNGTIPDKPFLLGMGFLTATLFLLLVCKRVHALRYLLLLLVIGELWYGFRKFNPFVPVSYVYPPNQLISSLKNLGGIDRSWGYGTARIESDLTTQVGLYSPDGTDPLQLSAYNRFVRLSYEGAFPEGFTRETRSDAIVRPGYGPEDLPGNPYRLKILDILGVKYLLDRTDNPRDETTFPRERFRIIDQTDSGYVVYENLNASPRHYIANNVTRYENDEDFSNLLFSETFIPGKSALINQDSADFQESGGVSDLLAYEAGYAKFRTDTQATSLLVLSDSYDTGWNATIDGTEVDTIEANYAFLGISVPAGTHTVELRYFPETVRYGFMLMAAGAIMLIAMMAYPAARAKKSKGSE